jgi:methylenetetrahydrofolate reductase (NADPH)
MRIDDILAGRARHGDPVFSFEFFPPKTPDGERNLQRALDSLSTLRPDFASVTYGAGGSTRDRTLDIVREIKDSYGIEAMAHLSCVGTTADELRSILDQVRAAGIENVLALRGDPPAGETEWRPHPGGLHYSTELASLIAADYEMAIGAACFPRSTRRLPISPTTCASCARRSPRARRSSSPSSSSTTSSTSISSRRRERSGSTCRSSRDHPDHQCGPDQAVHAACGASIPEPLLDALDGYADEPDSVLELGVAYATLQCADLLARGAPGIHFYVLNKAPSARAILGALRLQRPWERFRPERV